MKRYAAFVFVVGALVIAPSVASAYCQAVARNPFNGASRGRFSAATCKAAVAKCAAYAHGPQRCYVVSGY